MNLELQSERLLLRPLSESDLDISVEILTDPQVMRYVTAAYTREQVAEEMPVALKRGGGGCIGIWCVVDRAAGEKLGTAVLLPIPIEEKDTNWDLVGGPDLPDREIEIGYMLKPKAWGKGYATEITKRLLKFAFEATPLEEIVAVTDPHNEASKSVLLKSGLRYEGMRRAYASDCPGYRVTRQQWLAENS
jgi:ribosomal-protein-alanine N-acetyltransferase